MIEKKNGGRVQSGRRILEILDLSQNLQWSTGLDFGNVLLGGE